MEPSQVSEDNWNRMSNSEKYDIAKRWQRSTNEAADADPQIDNSELSKKVSNLQWACNLLCVLTTLLSIGVLCLIGNNLSQSNQIEKLEARNSKLQAELNEATASTNRTYTGSSSVKPTANKNTVKHLCGECSKEATYSLIGITGQREYLCDEHYKEMIGFMEIIGLKPSDLDVQHYKHP